MMQAARLNTSLMASATWCLSGIFWGVAAWCLSGIVPGGMAFADDSQGGHVVAVADTVTGDGVGDTPTATGSTASAITGANGLAAEFATATADAPVRLARFSYVRGTVSWRSDESSDWAAATQNLPVREGAEIWVTNGGRAELQFDDGSVLRLGNGALITLETLYSDSDGEFTQIKLSDGLASVRVRSDRAVYQIDTPLISIKANGPSRFRIGVAGGTEVAVTTGSATIEGQQGKITLNAGDYLSVTDATTPFAISSLPQADSFDQWNAQQDTVLDDAETPTRQYLPPNIALVAGDLDAYGTWHNDQSCGPVWCPHVTDADWRPYCSGQWTWVNPFGWTWVSNEAWGWAPYHYGTWIHEPYGWAWAPGPTQQYWCSALVYFTIVHGHIVWCPLAPNEVRYPPLLALPALQHNWARYFSIRQAAVYYPSGAHYCVARPFNTNYVNRTKFPPHHVLVADVSQFTGVRNAEQTVPTYAVNQSAYQKNNTFLPANAIRAAGATEATLAAFGGQGAYERLSRMKPEAFKVGTAIAAPPLGQPPVEGPPSAQPSLASLTPLRIYLSALRPPSALLNRNVYTAPLPARAGGAQAAIPGAAQAVKATGSLPGSGRPLAALIDSHNALSARGGNEPVHGVGAEGDRNLPVTASSANSTVMRSSESRTTDTGTGLRRVSSVRAPAPSAAERAASARATLGISPGNRLDGGGRRDLTVIYTGPNLGYAPRNSAESGGVFRSTGTGGEQPDLGHNQNQDAVSYPEGRALPPASYSAPPVYLPDVNIPMRAPPQQSPASQQPGVVPRQYPPVQRQYVPPQQPAPPMPRQEPSRPSAPMPGPPAPRQEDRPQPNSGSKH